MALRKKKPQGPGGRAGSTDITDSPAYRALHHHISIGYGKPDTSGSPGFGSFTPQHSAPAHTGPDSMPTRGATPNNGGRVPKPGKGTQEIGTGGTAVDVLTGGGITTDPRTGATTNHGNINGKPVQTHTRDSVTAVQKFLKGKGYAIKVDGVWGKQTASAVDDWHKGPGKRNSRAWSAAQGQPVAPDKPTNVKPGDKPKPDKPATAVSTSTDKPTNTKVNIPLPAGEHLGHLTLNSPQGQYISPKDWNALKTYDPKFADALAGMQFDPQIQQTKIQQARQVDDAKQSIHDISHWYDQVGTSLKTANTRNQEAGKQSVGNINDATKAILASLGGGANEAAGMVGAQGDANAAAQGQLNQAEAQYQNDLAPLLKDEAAGQMANQANINRRDGMDIAAQLASLMGQRGQAKSSALLQLLQANNDIIGTKIQGKQSAIQANNNTDQQTFGNRLNLANANLGIDQYNNQYDQQGFQNRISLEELRQAAALNNANVNYYNSAADQGNQGGFVPWAKANAQQRQALIGAAIGSITDANGAILPSYVKNPHAAWIAARTYLRGQGYNSAFKKTATDPKAYSNITDLIQGGLNKAYSTYQQRQAQLGQ